MDLINAGTLINQVIGWAAIGILGYVIAKVKALNKEHNSLKETAEHVMELEERMDERDQEISRKLDEQGEKLDKVIASQLDSTRSAIVRICEESLLKGCITDAQLANLHSLHTRYKALGGNGFEDNIFAKTCALEMVPSPESCVIPSLLFGQNEVVKGGESNG